MPLTEQLRESIDKNAAYLVAGRPMYDPPSGVDSAAAYLRWLEEERKAVADARATPTPQLRKRVAIRIANNRPFLDDSEGQDAGMFTRFRTADEPTFFKFLSDTGIFRDDTVPAERIDPWMDRYAAWIDGEVLLARTYPIRVMLVAKNNNSYVWGGKLFHAAAVQQKSPYGKHTLGIYELWLNRQREWLEHIYFPYLPPPDSEGTQLDLGRVHRDVMRITVSVHSKGPDLDVLGILALYMANNEGFLERIAKDRHAALGPLRAKDEAQLLDWLGRPQSMASVDLEPLVDHFNAYARWVQQERKRVQLALGVEHPVSNVLTQSSGSARSGDKQEQLTGKMNAARAPGGAVKAAQDASVAYLKAKEDAKKKNLDKHACKERIKKFLNARNRGPRFMTNYTTAKAQAQLESYRDELDELLYTPKLTQEKLGEYEIERDQVVALLEELRDLKKAEMDALAAVPKAKQQQAEQTKALADLIEEIKSFNKDFVRGVGEVKRVWQIMKKDGRISSADPLYQSVRQVIIDFVMRQDALLRRRELLMRQVEQLEKIDKVKRGLRVYCGFASVSYPVILTVGKFVTASFGKNLLVRGGMALGGAAAVAATATAENAAAGLFLGEMLPFLGDAIKLAGATETDTGKIEVTLSLGLGFGYEEIIDGSVALVYRGSIGVGDDRGFAAIASIGIEGDFQAGHKNLIAAKIQAELLNDKTEFKFKDAHHWAAWVASKWAKAAAWALTLGAHLYTGGKTGTPAKEELEFLEAVAQVFEEQHPHIRNTLARITPLLKDPVRRGDAFEILPKVSADLTAVGNFGLNASKETGETKYLLATTKEGAIEEKTKEAKTFVGIFGIKALIVSGQMKFTSVENHPNPDANGLFYNFQIKVGAGTKNLLSKPSETPEWVTSAGEENESIQKMLDLEEKLSSVSKKLMLTQTFWTSDNPVLQVVQQFNLANFEINCREVFLPSGDSKLCVQYIRGIYSTTLGGTRKIPVVAVPGLNVVAGASIGLTRTFREVLWPHTMSYLHLVYDGLSGIPEAKATIVKDGAPHEIKVRDPSGAELWEQFKEQHKRELRAFLKKIGKADSFIRKELEANALIPPTQRAHFEGSLSAAKKSLFSACEAYVKSPGPSAAAEGAKRLEEYLHAYNVGVFTKLKNEGWEAARRDKAQATLNPIALVGNLRATRRQLGKLHAVADSEFLGEEGEEDDGLLLGPAHGSGPGPSVGAPSLHGGHGPLGMASLLGATTPKSKSEAPPHKPPDKSQQGALSAFGALFGSSKSNDKNPGASSKKDEEERPRFRLAPNEKVIDTAPSGDCFFSSVAFWVKEDDVTRQRQARSDTAYATRPRDRERPSAAFNNMLTVRRELADQLAQMIWGVRHSDLGASAPARRGAGFAKYTKIYGLMSQNDAHGHYGASLFDYVKRMATDADVWGDCDLLCEAVQRKYNKRLVVKLDSDQTMLFDYVTYRVVNTDGVENVVQYSIVARVPPSSITMVNRGQHFDVWWRP